MEYSLTQLPRNLTVMALAVCYLPIFLPQQNAYKKVFTPEQMEA